MKQSARSGMTALLCCVLPACSGGGGGGSSSAPAQVSPCAGGPGSQASVSGTAEVSWDPLVAANLSGYRVYYGTAPRIYLQALGQGLNAGNFSSYSVAGLNRGSRYYFAVTAYDAADTESVYSNEVCKDIP